MAELAILNYGAGAVGLGLDSFLLKSGAELMLVCRQNTAAALRQSGLIRRGIFGDYKTPPDPFQTFTRLDDIVDGRFDFILVTVKSFDSAAAAADLAQHASLWDKNTKIVLCQNGWGNAEIFAEHFPKTQIYNARVITGFTRPQPNEVEITVHADAVHIGSLFHNDLNGIKDLCEAIGQGGLPCIPVQDITKDLWAKMLYNCALNPLGAVLGVSYGELAASEDSRSTMDTIIEEIYAVMEKCGYATHWATPMEYKKIFYKKLVPATAGHKSSTLQSLKSGKKTEVESLNGTVITLAAQHNIDVPANRAVYEKIKLLEEKKD